MNDNHQKILDAIANMSEGEVLLYGSTYNETLVIQEDELHLMFCYHGEMHKAARDYGDEAYQLLDEMYQKGAELDLPTDLRERIKAIVDGDECTRHDDPANVGGTKPAKPGSIDWMEEENIQKLRAPEIISNVVIRDNRKG